MDDKMAYRIIQGDALEVAKTQPDNSVHCITTSPPYFRLRKYLTAVWIDGDEQCKHVLIGQTCSKCGACYVDQQIGMEDSVNDYVMRLVELFRELRRVLHPSGVLLLNLGDSMAGSGGAGGDYNKGGKRAGQPKFAGTRSRDTHFKPKDLMMVPARVAIALCADGWWLRSKIIWLRESNMPESVLDRPTDCYEEVFLLTKSKKYYWDYIAVRERTTDGKGWRNARNVWTINPVNSGVKHYATMPVELAKKCIMAGSSEYGVCSKCLAPYKRIIKKSSGLPIVDEAENQGRLRANGTIAGDTTRRARMSGAKQVAWKAEHPDEILGWEPTCKCQDTEVIPSVVYDPFAGAGTTMLAAELLGRNSLGSELGAGYIAMAHERIARDLIKYSNLPRAREGKTEPEEMSIFSLEGIE